MAQECPICCESFSACKRKPVACARCDFMACSACVRRFLLSQTDELTCMGCRKPWDRQLLSEVLPKHFMHGGLKKWREAALFERERGMLPATVPLVAAKRELREQSACAAALSSALCAFETFYAACMLPLQRRVNSEEIVTDADMLDPRHAQLAALCATHGHPLPAEVAGFGLYIKTLNVRRRVLALRHSILRSYLHYARRHIWTGAVPLAWEDFSQEIDRGDDYGPDTDSEEEQEQATGAQAELQELRREQQALTQRLRRAGALERPRGATAGAYVAAYIRPCPVTDCRGFLSAKTYQCGVCEAKACKHCHELLPAAQAEAAAKAEATETHTCNPDNVASAELIMKETKPCPKCAVRIHKIDGCDQMWCAACHSAFSWRTGEIETHHIHNPHYYAWVREHNNGAVPREPGDQPVDECGIFFVRYDDWLRESLGLGPRNRRAFGAGAGGVAAAGPGGDRDGEALALVAISLYQLMQHCRGDELHRYALQHRQRDRNNFDLRVAYLENELSEKAFKQELHKREKRSLKAQSIHQIFDMYVNVQSDLFRNHMLVASRESVLELCAESDGLIRYANACFERCCKQYANAMPRIWRSPQICVAAADAQQTQQCYVYRIERFGTHAITPGPL